MTSVANENDGGRRAVVAATSGAHFIHDGLIDALNVLLPLWAQLFGLSYAEVGALRTALSTAMASGQIPSGLLAERIGERGLLAAGTVLAGAAYGALWFADGFWILFAAMVGLGLGEAVQHPLSSALISRAFGSGPRRAALGVYNFAGDLGKMVVVFATAAAIGMVGWQATVAGTGMLAVAIGIALLAGLAALSLGGRPNRRPGADDTPPATVGWGFNDRAGFALLSAIHGLDSSCRSVSLLLLPFVLVAKGADTASIGLALALVFAGGAAGKLACGLLTERFGVVATVIVTELATAALLATMIVAPLPWALICAAPFGLALNGTSSATYGSVGDFVAADRQARAFGLFYTVGSIAGATAPLVFGIVADLIGISAALSIMAGLVVLTVPLAVVLGPHLKHR